MNWTLEFLAVFAGVLTVLSPCILPILPPLLSASISGRLRHRPFWIVLGLATSFTLFGVTFATFGSFLGLSNAALRRVALIVLFFFSLSLLWPRLWEGIGVRIAALAQKIPGTNRLPNEQGRLNAILIGGSLGLVWAPCAGPILGIILTLAAVQTSFGRTLFFMSGYALGAAVPMLLIGYGGRRLSGGLLAFRAWGGFLQKTLGALTLAAVVALYFNVDTLLLARLPGSLFFSNRIEERLVGKQSTPSASGADLSASEVALDSTEKPLPVLGEMPEFAKITGWLNTPPLTSKKLRGKVVLVDFWTYSCINCIRTLPYVTRWYEKYKDQGFVVVGVHTPEFTFEKDEANVKEAIARHGIHYPVALDNDYGTWNAYDNHYWPAHYLIDANGAIREVHFGEGNYEETERAIQSLLAEARLLHRPMKLDPPKASVDFSRIHSFETYVGYARTQHFASPEPIAEDRTGNYTAPSTLPLNRWALTGVWKIGPEAATLQAPGGAIRFRFDAPKLNLVMKGIGKGTAGKVLIDGVPIAPALRGDDVRADGKVEVKDSKLYNLVSLPGDDSGEHLFELIFDDPNVALYAFTFG